jgi:hypothetical protein
MSERLERWIAHLCRDGKGEAIALTVEQRQLLQLLYDGPPPPVAHLVEGILAAPLSLSSLCGPTMGDTRATFATDDDQMWRCASPELQSALERDAEGHVLYSSRWPILTT